MALAADATLRSPRHRQVVDFDRELDYWREHFRDMPCYRPGWRYSDIEPALKLGIDAFIRQPDSRFEDIAPHLLSCYERLRGFSQIDWSEAMPVVAAAWSRLKRQDQRRDVHLPSAWANADLRAVDG